MKHKSKGGLGKYIYMEWLIPIKDYYFSIRKNELIFEIVVPFLASLLCTLIYFNNGKIFIALDGLAELLPTAISILIGFTVMLITLLLTSNGDHVKLLKTIETDKVLYNMPVTLYQGLHIQFVHSLFSEIFLLLFIFLYLFLKGVCLHLAVGVVILGIEIYLTLNILLAILRGISNLYFSFYNSQKQK
jgi:hypothetical protein